MNYNEIDWDNAVQESINDFKKSQERAQAESKGFDPTLYFNLKLEDGEKTGEVTVRIMQLAAGKDVQALTTWYEEVPFHSRKVDGKWRKFFDPAHDGKESPLNDMYEVLNNGSPDDRKLAYTYKSRPMYILRVIERGKENEGPKFWRFSNTDNGVMQKIRAIINRLNNKSKGAGAIWRVDQGRDLTIDYSLDKKGYVVVNHIIAEDPSPLSEDPKLIEKWVNDTKTWRDAYKEKSLDYLNIIADNLVPVYDRTLEKYVPKTEDGEVASSPSSRQYTAPQDDDNVEDPSDFTAEELETDDLPF